MANRAQVMTVKLAVVGPIKRSTVHKEAPDPIAEAITDLLHWSWCVRLQHKRFVQSWEAEFQAWSGRPWRRCRQLLSTASYEEHIFMVTAANLDRALDQAARAIPKPLRLAIRLPKDTRRALHLLRDIYEHWDELRAQYRAGALGGAAERLRVEFPKADPWSSTYERGQIVVADVVHLTPLVAQIRRLEARLLRYQRQRAREQRAIKVS